MGTIGSLPVRSLAETDQPGIQLINQQADLHQRPVSMRTDGYILAWATTELLIEAYIQTGNRVGFDHVNGAEFKNTLENIVYAPLDGVEQIDFQKGQLRALTADRIGEMHYLGQDGKTPVGEGNPPKTVDEGGDDGDVEAILVITKSMWFSNCKVRLLKTKEPCPLFELIMSFQVCSDISLFSICTIICE